MTEKTREVWEQLTLDIEIPEPGLKILDNANEYNGVIVIEDFVGKQYSIEKIGSYFRYNKPEFGNRNHINMLMAYSMLFDYMEAVYHIRRS